MLDSLRSLGTRGSKLIRLDAFGYATKTPGTRCFFQVSQLAASLYLCKFHLGICEGLKVPVKWLAIAHHHWLMGSTDEVPFVQTNFLSNQVEDHFQPP